MFAGCDNKEPNPSDNASEMPSSTTNTNTNGDNATEGTTESTENSVPLEDWREIEILIDGHAITLPCTYKELKETVGLSLTEFDEDEAIPAGWYMPTNMLDNDGNECLYIEIKNTFDKDTPAKDCMVIEVGHYLEQIEDSEVKVTFGGLQVGDEASKQDIIKRFGEPDTIEEFRAEKEYQKEWETDSYRWYVNPDAPDDGYFEVVVNIHTNLIEEISFDRKLIAD